MGAGHFVFKVLEYKMPSNQRILYILGILGFTGVVFSIMYFTASFIPYETESCIGMSTCIELISIEMLAENRWDYALFGLSQIFVALISIMFASKYNNHATDCH